MNKKLTDSSLIFLKGLGMGIANIIPGVSGGTVALITGIYERLINAIKGVDFKFVVYFLQGKKEEAKENIAKIDFALLVPLAFGVGCAILLLTNLLSFLLEDFPALTYAFFFGLILASAGIVYKDIKFNLKLLLPSLLGFVLAFYLSGGGTIQSSHSLPIIFFSGVLAICAMILPGISGAFILLFLGQYEYILNALKTVDVVTILVFMLGAAIGLISFARLLSFLFKRYRGITLAFLVGLMLGALRSLYLEIVGAGPHSSGESLGIGLIGVAGFVGVIGLHYLAEKKKKIEQPGE